VVRCHHIGLIIGFALAVVIDAVDPVRRLAWR
jgi:hypothetical protein